MTNPLDSLVFITVSAEQHLPAEVFDASIPLPVQLASPGAKFDPAGLSLEMILAGMLTVFAYDPENAHLAYYRAIMKALRPNIRSEMTEAGILNAKNGDFELAEEIFLALRGYDPEDRLTVLNLALLMDERADAMRKSGLEDEADAFDANAFEYYRLAMMAEPPIPDSFFNAGFFYLKQKNYAKARAALETYLKLETDSGESGKFRKQKAREIVDEISSRNLDDDLFKSAYDYITMGQEEKALEQIRLFMEHHAKVWNAWFLLGWALRRLERWEDARQAFTQALELGNRGNSGIAEAYVEICNELAICLMELGDLEGSKTWLLSALEQEPENTKVISNLGTVALKQGKQEEAAGFFRTVLEIDPRDRLAREMLSGTETKA